MCCVYTDIRTFESIYYALPAGASEWDGETRSIHEDAVRFVYGDKYNTWKQSHTTLCNLVFSPYCSKKIDSVPSRIHLDDTVIFNTYVQPGWRWNLTPADAPDRCPETVRKHLMHLLNADSSAIEYVLQWIKSSLTRKNQTWLGLVGETKGTGKGLLAELVLRLHGMDDGLPSVDKAKSDTFEDKFNGVFGGKTMVMIDELELAATDTKRLKEMWSEYISVERKGVDAVTSKNYCNGLFLSNSLGAIKVEDGDRRFSMVDINPVKMDKTFGADELKIHAEAMLRDPQLLRDFGAWLLYKFESKCDPDAVYQSQTRQDMLDSSTPEWVKDVESYASGLSQLTTVTYDANVLAHVSKHMPGRDKMFKAFRASKLNWFVVATKFNGNSQVKLVMGPGANPDATPPADYVAPKFVPTGRVEIPPGFVEAFVGRSKPVDPDDADSECSDPDDNINW
jgi:hypothetical protein